MRKRSRRHAESHTDVGSTATAPRPLTPDADTAGYSALVTGGSRLSQGAIIHATVYARVLRVNLLRLDATIEAAPAQLNKVRRLVLSLGSSARPGPEPLPRPRPVIGSSLDQALGLLNEGAASLAATKERRPPPQQRRRPSSR